MAKETIIKQKVFAATHRCHSFVYGVHARMMFGGAAFTAVYASISSFFLLCPFPTVCTSGESDHGYDRASSSVSVRLNLTSGAGGGATETRRPTGSQTKHLLRVINCEPHAISLATAFSDAHFRAHCLQPETSRM
jgi:hypothetical protein